MGASTSIKTAGIMGGTMIVIITLTAAVTGAIFEFVLQPLGIVFLSTFIFIAIIVGIVKALSLLVKQYAKKHVHIVEMYWPILALNCAILGVTVINARMGNGVLTSTVNGLAAAVGFSVVIIIFAAVRERITHDDIPLSFRGMPILLLTAGLMAMAFYGFSVLLF
jgi:electron transport complex protein RnfA